MVAIFCLPIIYGGYKYFSLDGYEYHVYDFDNRTAFVSRLFPTNRLGEIAESSGEHYQEITVDPVYFRVKMPVSYETADITLKFHPGELSIIDVGVAKDPEAKGVALYPIYNKLISEMINDPEWAYLIEDDNILLQRGRLDYDDIQDFNNSPSSPDRTALLNYEIKKYYQIPGYKRQYDKKQYQTVLRGKHTILAYAGIMENLYFNFRIDDFHPQDKIEVRDFAGDLVYEEYIANNDGEVSVQNMMPGYYHVFLNFDDDTLIKQINTTNHKWVFDREIRLAETQMEEPKIFSRANRLYFQALDEGGVQMIEINADELNIEARNKQYIYDADRFEDLSVALRSGGLIINSTGLIALDEESYFNPKYRNLRAFKDYQAIDVDYVLANYREPYQTADGWLEKKVRIDLAGAYYDEDNKVKFVISAPDSTTAEDKLKVSRIEVELHRQPVTLSDLWRKLKERIK